MSCLCGTAAQTQSLRQARQACYQQSYIQTLKDTTIPNPTTDIQQKDHLGSLVYLNGEGSLGSFSFMNYCACYLETTFKNVQNGAGDSGHSSEVKTDQTHVCI